MSVTSVLLLLSLDIFLPVIDACYFKTFLTPVKESL